MPHGKSSIRGYVKHACYFIKIKLHESALACFRLFLLACDPLGYLVTIFEYFGKV